MHHQAHHGQHHYDQSAYFGAAAATQASDPQSFYYQNYPSNEQIYANATSAISNNELETSNTPSSDHFESSSSSRATGNKRADRGAARTQGKGGGGGAGRQRRVSKTRLEQVASDQQQVGGEDGSVSGAEERASIGYCAGETTCTAKQVSATILTNGNCNNTSSNNGDTSGHQSVKCERIDDNDDSAATIKHSQKSGDEQERAGGGEETSQAREADHNNCELQQERSSASSQLKSSTEHHGTKQSLIAR